MAKNEVKIPDTVLDKEAYLQFLKLQKNPFLTKGYLFQASDGNEYNLGLLRHHLKKRTEHLPEKEQDKLWKQKKLYDSLKGKLNFYKRKAFMVSGGRGKLNNILNSRAAEIIELYGRMFDDDQIVKIVNEDFGIPASKATLQKFRRSHADKIQELIDKHRSDFSDLRLGVKRSRLEELSLLYNDRKERYFETKSREDYKLLLQTLSELRKESEGEQFHINGKIDLSYEINVNVHIQKEILKTLPLKEIILGKVAARMGLKVEKLVYYLENSHYAKISNVLGEYDEEAEGEIIYPSQLNYNFDEIRKKNEAMEKEIQIEKNDEAEMTEAEKIKQMFINKLKIQKTSIIATEKIVKNNNVK